MAMRYSETHKEETRQKVLKAAARQIRARGPSGVSVAEVMAEAGLTHGGFYAHFPSKDALVGAAITYAFDDRRAKLREAAAGMDDAGYLANFVEAYVSAGHRDRPERGCPITTLSTDLPRMGEPARAAFDAGVNQLVQGLAGRLAVGEPAEREALAGSLVAEMAGAVTLARAVSDPVLSDAILERTRRSVKARMGLRDSSPEQGETP
jgi:TetR/AcrR family transcriptional repressor of nem operon